MSLINGCVLFFICLRFCRLILDTKVRAMAEDPDRALVAVLGPIHDLRLLTVRRQWRHHSSHSDRKPPRAAIQQAVPYHRRRDRQHLVLGLKSSSSTSRTDISDAKSTNRSTSSNSTTSPSCATAFLIVFSVQMRTAPSSNAPVSVAPIPTVSNRVPLETVAIVTILFFFLFFFTKYFVESPVIFFFSCGHNSNPREFFFSFFVCGMEKPPFRVHQFCGGPLRLYWTLLLLCLNNYAFINIFFYGVDNRRQPQ